MTSENCEMNFPSGFVFGAATSPHQTEGGNTKSDWWLLETMPGSPLAEASGAACDSFNRWREDMDLLAGAGLTAYRFGIEWARIEPTEGEFDQAALDHYSAMIDGAIERGIEPIVTLHHFTSPAWFAMRGGWLVPDAPELFARYVEHVVPLLSGRVRRVVTINEPNMVAIMARVLAGEATFDTGLGGMLPAPSEPVRDALIAAHHAARHTLKTHISDLEVGWSVANQCVQWTSEAETEGLAYRQAVEDPFISAAAGDDFIGVQAYTRTIISPNGKVDTGGERTLTGWEYYPEAIGQALRDTARRLPGVPLLITENGIATDDDTRRIAYTTGALEAVSACIADGLDVRGYVHWSLLDNYEWGHWGPTFGLVAVDRETFERTPKPSLAWLGEFAQKAQR